MGKEVIDNIGERAADEVLMVFFVRGVGSQASRGVGIFTQGTDIDRAAHMMCNWPFGGDEALVDTLPCGGIAQFVIGLFEGPLCGGARTGAFQRGAVWVGSHVVVRQA